MSSGDETVIPAFKKRKLQRACDYCRRKKVKCDGPQIPDKRCSNCTARRTECTYLQGHNRNYPKNYVEDLESRLGRMEKLMNRMLPDVGVDKGFGTHEFDNEAPVLSPMAEGSHASAIRASGFLSPSTFSITPPTPRSPQNDLHIDEEEGDIDGEISEGMRRLSMNSHSFRYHGRSSGMLFIRSAMALKDECIGSRPKSQGDKQHPWVRALVEDDFPTFHESSFPPRDLIGTLVDLYFHHTNRDFPLLHEPTFKEAVETGQHLRNGGLGATILLVCAIGSRFTRDPRVLLDHSDHPHSAGWKWFLHVERARRLSFAPAKLHDLQVYALMALFLDGTTAPQATWTVVGAGVRAALEVGVHRKKMYASTPNVEEELLRRAFWILVLLEWTNGYGFGRPCSIHDEDFDLALPTECDDEYWLTSDGEPLFKQPPGKPSKLSGFVYALRLMQILACANRTIYATNKSRAQLGHADQQWEQRIVADLDSALNKWADSLPEHLRWNPEQENELFLTQAATLSTWHHGLQIAVHRSFMSSSRRESPISLPSTIICTNAARTSIQVAEVLYKRTGRLTHRSAGIIYVSAVVLVTIVLSSKRSGRMVSNDKDLTLVGRTAEMLRSLRNETHYADSLADTLCDLMSGIAESLPARVSMSMDHPTSPVTIPVESKPLGQHTQPNALDNGRHHTANIDHLGGGPSFASLTFAHSSTMPNRPPSFNFSPPNTSHFAIPLPSAELNSPPTQGSLPINGPMHRVPTEQPAPPPTIPHSHAYAFESPFSPNDRLQPQWHSDMSDSTNRESHGDIGGGRMYGLESLGHSPYMSPPFPPSISQVAVGGNVSGLADVAMQREAGGSHAGDTNVPDFALMDDTLAMWSGIPAVFGWNDWDTSYTNTSNPAGT